MTDGMMKMDGFDDCVVGVAVRFGQPDILCYDIEKVIAKLMKDGCSRDDAFEFFEYNQLGMWVGETTPCFLRGVLPFELEEEEAPLQ